MKKLSLFALLISMCLDAMAFSTDDINGHWVSEEIPLESADPKEHVTLRCDYTFYDTPDVKIKYTLSYDLTYNRKLSIDAFCDITALGSYQVEADSVVINFYKPSIQIDIPEDHIRVTGIGLEDGIDQRDMKKQLREMLMKFAELLFLGEDDKIDVLKNMDISEKKFKCTIDGRAVTFKRKK